MRRVRPILEGLEGRQVMSADPLGGMSGGANVDPMTSMKVDLASVAEAEAYRDAQDQAARAVGDARAAAAAATAAAAALPTATPAAGLPSNGTFAKNNQQFTYTTPRGTRVVLSIQGRGSLEGTYVDGAGALNLRYSKTNLYSKIVSNVNGGDGRALLASVYTLTQAQSGTQNSTSGIGSPVIGMINLPKFDLVPGGTFNAEAGVGVVALRSAGPGSQIQLRELTGMEPASNRYDARGNSPTYNASLANIIDTSSSTSSGSSGSSSSSSSGGSGTTLTGSGSSNTANPVISDVFLVQTLAGGDGEFVSAGNLLLTTTSHGDPGLPKPPPGVVIAIDRIQGDLSAVPDLQTDSRIFGYDPTTGQVLRFQLDLNKGAGVVDPAWTPISVPGAPQDVGLALGRDGQRLVLLVNDGASISAYDATYGTALGSFTVPAGYFATGSTDSFTVIGNVATNQLEQIDVSRSLAAGTAVKTASNYTPPAGLSLLGGITGLPGSNNVYTSVAAPFNTLQPLANQLGYLNVSVTTTRPAPMGGQNVVNQFGTVQQKAFQQNGAYVTIPGGNPNDTATSVGSVDRNLAVNTGVVNGAAAPNTIRLFSQVTQTAHGSIVLAYPNQLSDLSESFRPDLAGSVLIDVQGTIQSIRGSTADGMVLNDSGFLNLISFQRVTNSAIVGQPVGHVLINKRDANTTISSTSRTVAGRGGVTFVPDLQQLGPLSQTRNRPQA